MNILYIDHYAGSLSLGMEYRPFYFAQEWQKLGHHVVIMCASYSHLRTNNPQIDMDFCKQSLDGVDYCFVKTNKYKRNGLLRLLSIMTFVSKLSVHAKFIANEFKPDVIITSSTYPNDTFAAQKIVKFSKAKLIHEAHDLWPLTLVELAGMKRANPFICWLQCGEDSAINKSDTVVGVLPFEYLHFQERGLENINKFHYIPNGINISDWENPEPLDDKIANQLQCWKKCGDTIICYCGGHALSNSLDTLIESASLLKSNKIRIILVGKGEEKNRLQKKSTELNCTNVTFFPPIRKAQVPSLLKQVDATYIGAKKTRLYKYGVSMNKLYDYMMAGKPIIYAVEAANNEVSEARCGITVEAENPEKLAGAIMKIESLGKDEINEMGFRGKIWVMNNRNYKALSDQFLSIIDAIMD